MESEKLDCGDTIKEAFIASPVSGDTCKKVGLQDVEALSHCKMTIENVTVETVSQCKDMESEKLTHHHELKKMFIVSPVNIDTCEKVKQQDVETLSYRNISVEGNTTELMLQSEDMEIKKPHCDILLKKEFIASPAGIDACQKVELQKAEVLSIDKNEYKETMLQSEGMENEKPHCDISSEKKFITSPVDVDTHRKVKLQDAEVLNKYKIDFEKLCEEYSDIFSKDSSDIGKTP